MRIDRRSEPAHRAVAEDETEERGGNIRWLGRLIPTRPADDAADDDADAADTDADADADAADTDADAADTDADADADAADDADADDAADAADDDDAEFIHAVNRFWKGNDMREGLVLVQLPGRYWSVTRVGWARRLAGDEWELCGTVTVIRTGAVSTLDALASDGPGKTHRTTPPAKAAELLHRLTVRRVFVADEKAWAKACPRPVGF